MANIRIMLQGSAVLDAHPGGIIYQDMIPDYVQVVRTVYEGLVLALYFASADNFGEVARLRTPVRRTGRTSPAPCCGDRCFGGLGEMAHFSYGWGAGLYGRSTATAAAAGGRPGAGDDPNQGSPCKRRIQNEGFLDKYLGLFA
jgi:hypothetical protein